MMHNNPRNNNSNSSAARRSSKQNNRAPYLRISSLSSYDSGCGGGGKIKARMLNKPSFTKRVSSFHTTPMMTLKTSTNRRRVAAVTKSSVELCQAGQRRSSAPTANNEEWDAVSKEGDSFASSKARASNFVAKWTSTNSWIAPIKKKKTKRVSFVTKGEIIGTTAYASLPIESVWYTSETCNTFLADSLSTARAVRRLMAYASTVNASYNSATGLVSVSTLPELLSSPQEIIGIEKHLSGQQSARVSLKSNHKRVCFTEQRHLDLGGYTLHQDILAARLANYSNISAHMAKERASYSLALSD